jgi:tetratricopeptide (TPR) repeat protein
MRTINTRFLLFLVAGLVITSAVVAGVHALQSQRIAAGLLHQAERGEEQGRLDVAARFLSRYLELEPDDNEARARLGRMVAAQAATGSPRTRERALFLLEKVLLQDPNRFEERLLLVPIALGLNRQELAGEHLKVLQEQAPEDGRVDALVARWHFAQSRPADAIDAYRKAIEHAPQTIANYLALADLLRRQMPRDDKKDQEADKVIDALVASNEENPAAHLARWDYLRKWHPPQTPEAIRELGKDVQRAQELDPDSAATLLATCELADLQGETERASALLRDGIHRFPTEVPLYRAFAALELRAGRGVEAAACFRDGAQRVSGAARQDLLWAEANVRADLGKPEDVVPVLEQMRKAGCSRPALDYIEARLLVLRARWSEAAQAFERLRPLLENKAELVETIDLALARCYAQLGEPVRQQAACQRVLTANPASVPARQGMVEAFLALGRVDDALEQSTRLMKQPGSNAAGWTQVARLALLRNLGQPRKNWSEVETALEEAAKASPDSAEVVLLTAELRVAQDRATEARALLETARTKKPEELRFLAALADLTDRAGETAKAEHLLKEGEHASKNSAVIRAARARFCGRHADARGRERLKELGQDLEHLRDGELDQLLPTLAEENYRVGNVDEARRLWTKLAAQPLYANDLRLRLQLFTMAVRAADEAATTQILEEVERIEHGRGPSWHFCEAQRLIDAARKGNDAALDEARTHLDTVTAQRPSWAAVPLARAEIERQRENWEAAIAHYHRAIDLGGRTVAVTRELVQTLIRCRRFAEAEREIRQLQTSDLAASGLGRVAAELSLRNQEPALAVKAALEAVSESSTDHRDHLWLGQMLAAADPLDAKAEKHLRQAVALAERSPETWVALVQYLAAAGKKKESEAALDEAKGKVPAELLPPMLAPCYEALGRFDDAEKSYRKTAEREKTALALRELAHFYVRRDRSADAEVPMKTIMGGEVKVSEDERIVARHDLAWLLAGTPSRFNEALTLVGLSIDDAGRIEEKSKPSDADAAREERARARVLARAARPTIREQAIARLDALGKRQALGAEERFLLAELYASRNELQRAREILRELLTAEANNPVYLAGYSRILLQLEQVDEAERCVEKLLALEKGRRLEANALGAVELRAQVCERRGKAEEAIQLLLPLTRQANVKPEQLSLVIGCYARQKRFNEALNLCGRAWETCPPEVAARMSAAVLRTGVTDREQIARAEGWLQAAIQKTETPPSDLLLCLADLKDLQGKYADAEAAYRRLLAREPDHATALNNLAWLLAARGAEGEESLKLINRAIDVAGPNPAFLDTRAFVQLALQNPNSAREDLEKSARGIPEAAHYLHLARTHSLAKDLPAASAALNRARAAGLDPDRLHPLEKPLYQKLLESLPER